MKALLRQQPFHKTFEPHLDIRRPPEILSRQPQGRTLSWQLNLSYPSPPMSSPSSPQRKLIDNIPTTTSSISGPAIASTSSAHSSSHTAAPSIIPSGTPAGAPLSSERLVSHLEPHSAETRVPALPTHTSTSSPSDSQALLVRTESASSASVAVDIQPTAGPSTSTGSPSAGRSVRRSKAHVASACNNCKRAHLSCDVERPCNRCVQTGKLDTCRDVPHKKRGRPRLRDEGDFRVQQPEVAISLTGSSETGPSAATARELSGASRLRRTGSLRTLRSYPDSSAPPLSMTRSQTVLDSTFAPQQSDRRLTQGLVTPIAFLDLDLVIIKANRAFQNLMGFSEIGGMHLTDIARPFEAKSFQTARNSLRAEREAKEPAYLPPILQPGLDPVSGITDQDVDEITRGFDDQHYTWIFRLAGRAERTLAVRVRLAKTSLYFVTLFLPPLPETQIEQAPLSALGPPVPLYHMPASSGPPPLSFQGNRRHFVDPSPPGRIATTLPTPPSPFFHTQTAQQGPHLQQAGPPPHFQSRSHLPFETQPRFPTDQIQPQYQQPPFSFHPPTLPQGSLHTVHEQPLRRDSVSTSVGSAPSPFVPPSPYLPSFATHRNRSETLESLGRHVQTRLRADSGVTSSAMPQSSPRQQRGIELSRSSSDESGASATAHGASPRKRRRMTLDEVLHER